ncbi:Uncharacterised protein [Cytobacillus firmus]|uniref:hypothetical protein n=1 Tax=Cytobacillus firmus TaxID=1399 RepID=UPI000E185204|nr:hypothetical protein [Cytobacillus firmus]SUY32131.1 Uncharacterised protein [Cytobacillus firmus]
MDYMNYPFYPYMYEQMNMDAFFQAEDQEEDLAFLDFQAAGQEEASASRDFRQEGQEEASDHQDRHREDRVEDLGRRDSRQDSRAVEEALEDRMDRHQLRRQTSPLKCSRSAHSLLIPVP